MTTERKIIAALAAALVVICAVVSVEVYRQHRMLESADKVRAANDAERRLLQQQIDTRDKADVQQQQAAQWAIRNVKTSGDAVRILRQVVSVPAAASAAPQTVVAQAADLSPQLREQMPDAPAYVVQTQDAAISTSQTLLQCRADQASLSTCQADKLDLQRQLADEQKTSAAWRDAAKGGSTAKRVLQVAKCAAFAGGGGALGQVAGGQARWAALGAAAGAVACRFVF